MIVSPIVARTDTIKVKCVGSAYGLKKNQVYIVEARMGRKNRFTDFNLIDGDGDVFTICKEDLNKEFEIVEGDIIT